MLTEKVGDTLLLHCRGTRARVREVAGAREAGGRGRAVTRPGRRVMTHRRTPTRPSPVRPKITAGVVPAGGGLPAPGSREARRLGV